MRLRELVTEIERIEATAYVGGKRELDQTKRLSRFNKILQSQKPLPGGSDLTYALDVLPGRFDSSDDISIYILHKDEIVGKLKIGQADTQAPEPAFYVNTITVAPEYQGQGIAQALYGIVLTILKKPLIAGGSQTPGGRKNWIRLSQVPGVEIFGYVELPDWMFQKKYREINPGKLESLQDKIMATGGVYWGKGRQSSDDVHFFLFPVEPGQTEITPVIKNALQTYSDIDGGEVETGLMARWTGK